MSAIEEPTVVSEPSSNMPAMEEPTVVSEPTEKTKKAMLRGYPQKLMTIKARIKYREHALKTFRKHLKHGTFPQRMKSIQPYRKTNFPNAQAVVNAACTMCDFGSNDSRRREKTYGRSRTL